MNKQRVLNIENAKLIFRNFSGKETDYNKKGDRNFAVIINDADMAECLLNDGWNVKPLKPRDEDDEPRWQIPVSVSFKVAPPKVWLVKNGNTKSKTLLKEDNINVLDFADIDNADIIINPYHWEVNGKSGIKAYLKTAYVTIQTDAFESKYSDAEECGVYEEAPSEDDLPF